MHAVDNRVEEICQRTQLHTKGCSPTQMNGKLADYGDRMCTRVCRRAQVKGVVCTAYTDSGATYTCYQTDLPQKPASQRASSILLTTSYYKFNERIQKSRASRACAFGKQNGKYVCGWICRFILWCDARTSLASAILVLCCTFAGAAAFTSADAAAAESISTKDETIFLRIVLCVNVFQHCTRLETRRKSRQHWDLLCVYPVRHTFDCNMHESRRITASDANQFLRVHTAKRTTNRASFFAAHFPSRMIFSVLWRVFCGIESTSFRRSSR